MTVVARAKKDAPEFQSQKCAWAAPASRRSSISSRVGASSSAGTAHAVAHVNGRLRVLLDLAMQEREALSRAAEEMPLPLVDAARRKHLMPSQRARRLRAAARRPLARRVRASVTTRSGQARLLKRLSPS